MLALSRQMIDNGSRACYLPLMELWSTKWQSHFQDHRYRIQIALRADDSHAGGALLIHHTI